MNLAYSFGMVCNESVKLRHRGFLPGQTNYFVWDTAVAISRKHLSHVFISYLNINFTGNYSATMPYTVVSLAGSLDGGETWAFNGATSVQPTGNIGGVPFGAGDNAGVSCDQHGVLWYLSTNYLSTTGEGQVINQPFIMSSLDDGQTWTLQYTFPYNSPSYAAYYDFPEMCYGYYKPSSTSSCQAQAQYGIYITVDFQPEGFTGLSVDGYPILVFLPVTGPGTVGTAQLAELKEFTNNTFLNGLTSSDDGRLWMYGTAAGLNSAQYAFPGGKTTNRLAFHSPGHGLDSGWSGPFSVMNYNSLSNSLYLPIWKSMPVFGLFQSVQCHLYDNKRHALYVILNATYPDESQDSVIYFLISTNNGQTFLDPPLIVNSSKKGNRGLASMALDSIHGDVLIGFYRQKQLPSFLRMFVLFKDGLIKLNIVQL